MAIRKLLIERFPGKVKVEHSERVEGDLVRVRFLLSCRLCGNFNTTSVAQMAKHLEAHPKPTLWQRVKCRIGLN